MNNAPKNYDSSNQLEHPT